MKAKEWLDATQAKANKAVREDESIKELQKRAQALQHQMAIIQQDIQVRAQIVSLEVWTAELNKIVTVTLP